MTQILKLEQNDQIFTAIQRQAEAIGVPTEKLVATLEQQFEQVLKSLLPEAEKEKSRAKFERHVGTLNLKHPTDLDNESIDADLLKNLCQTRANMAR